MLPVFAQRARLPRCEAACVHPHVKAQCVPCLDARTPRAEFLKVAGRTGLGFIVMGLIGFFVKLVLCVRRCTHFASNGRQLD